MRRNHSLWPLAGQATSLTTVLSALMLACFGCAGASGAPPLTAEGAPAASYSCRVVGPTRIVAKDVYAGDAVASVTLDGGLEVVLVDRVEPCLHVGFRLGSESAGGVLGACPERARGRATSRDGVTTYLARQRSDDGRSHVDLGYMTYDWASARFGASHEASPEEVWHRLFAPSAARPDGESAPALAAFGDDGIFLAWVERGTVRGAPLAGGAEPATMPLDLARGDLGIAAIGKPSVAFSQSGAGLVAFTAATRTGVHALATPIACGGSVSNGR